jgi:hypothetical protein
VHHWLASTVSVRLAGRGQRATRPLHFSHPDSPMLDGLELRLASPTELGPEAEVLAELRERVRAIEAEQGCADRVVGTVDIRGRLPKLDSEGHTSRMGHMNAAEQIAPTITEPSTWARDLRA